MNVSYSEQIRHPSGALNAAKPSEPQKLWREKHPTAALLVWLAIAGLIVYGLWRANAIQKAAAALGAVVENPYGWV